MRVVTLAKTPRATGRGDNVVRRPLWEFLIPPSQFGDPDRTGVSARGVRVRMASGRELLCGTSGLWNVSFGYGHPAVTSAIADELQRASYFGLFRGSNVMAERAADELIRVCGPAYYERVLFATSGSAANDLVMKVARTVSRLRGDGSRNLVVGLRGSYHGQTYGALSMSGQDLGQMAAGADRRYVRHVDPFDGGTQLQQLCEVEGDRISVLILEPVLGTGAQTVPPDFIALVGQLADHYQFQVAADEVATGLFRTGPFRASTNWARQPDFVLLSKALTNGTCAASAIVASKGVAEIFDLHDAELLHGETQAGTSVSAAAMLATLEVAQAVAESGNPARVSAALDARLRTLQRDSGLPLVLSGLGCFRGVSVAQGAGIRVTPDQVTDLVCGVRQAGGLIQPAPAGFQLVPSLTYESGDLEQLLDSVAEAMHAWQSDLIR